DRRAKSYLTIYPSLSGSRLTYLLDHLVGASDQRGRHLKAECLRGLEVDNKLQRCWLNDWQVTRFEALEDLPGVHAHLTIQIGQAGAIAHQAAGYGITASFVDRRYFAACGQKHEALALTVEERVTSYEKGLHCGLSKGCEGSIKLAFGANT